MMISQAGEAHPSGFQRIKYGDFSNETGGRMGM